MLAALVKYTEQHELDVGSTSRTDTGAMHLIGKLQLTRLKLPFKT